MMPFDATVFAWNRYSLRRGRPYPAGVTASALDSAVNSLY
jgi:hypothetical protein